MKQDRKFELVLYPDAENYTCNDVIIKAESFFTYWAWILHDEDILDDGSPKKPHIHFIGKRDTIITPKGVCYQLGIPENSLANIHSWKDAVRYLIHDNSPDKYQYSLENVSSNFDLTRFFHFEKSDTEQAQIIYNFLASYNFVCPYPIIVKYVIENDLWPAYRRGFAVWSQLNDGGRKHENRRL